MPEMVRLKGDRECEILERERLEGARMVHSIAAALRRTSMRPFRGWRPARVSFAPGATASADAGSAGSEPFSRRPTLRKPHQRACRLTSTLAKVALTSFVATTLVGCAWWDDDDTDAQGCADPPALADFGDPSPRAPMTTVNLEFGPRIVAETVQGAVQTPTTLPQGVRVDSVTLQQVGSGADEMNLVAVNLTPWLRILGSRPVYLSQYVLRVRAVPYVVNASTVPDEARRRQILGTTAGGSDSGAVVRMEFYDFSRIAGDGKVACQDSQFSLIDKRVLDSIYTGFVVSDGRITTSSTRTTVDGTGTKFKDAFAAAPQWDPTEWDIHRASDMQYVGRIAAVADNVSLTMKQPALVDLNREAYVALKRPLVLPTDMITNLLKRHPATGGFMVRGVNIATQDALKIGLDVHVYNAFGGGWNSMSTLPFTRQPSIQPTDDWLLAAQAGYLERALRAQVARTLEEQGETRITLTRAILAPGPFPTSPVVITTTFGVNVPFVYYGTLQITAQVTPRVRRGLADKPTLVAPLSAVGISPVFGPAVLVAGGILENIDKAYKSARTTSGCEGALVADLEFEAFGSNRLYPTGVVVTPSPPTFVVSGRSSLIDRKLEELQLPARPPIPKC